MERNKVTQGVCELEMLEALHHESVVGWHQMEARQKRRKKETTKGPSAMGGEGGGECCIDRKCC